MIEVTKPAAAKCRAATLVSDERQNKSQTSEEDYSAASFHAEATKTQRAHRNSNISAQGQTDEEEEPWADAKFLDRAASEIRTSRRLEPTDGEIDFMLTDGGPMIEVAKPAAAKSRAATLVSDERQNKSQTSEEDYSAASFHAEATKTQRAHRNSNISAQGQTDEEEESWADAKFLDRAASTTRTVAGTKS